MKENRNHQHQSASESCTEFQEHLPEFFESGADLTNDPHLRSCETCAALVRDLEYIAQQAKLLLPLHDPSPAVWQNIQSAIQHDSGQPGKKENETSAKQG